MVQFLAPFLDGALVLEVAQHVTQRSTVGVLQPERACNLAHACLALVRADEGDNVFAGGEARGPVLLGGLLQDDAKVGSSWRRRQTSGADLTFATHSAAGSQSECQIQSSTST